MALRRWGREGPVAILAKPWKTAAACAAAGLAALLAVASLAARQASRPVAGGGQELFERLCSRCHGVDGRGGEMGPGIVAGIALRSDDEIRGIVKDGLPARGMPGLALTDAESRALVAFTRTLRPRRESRPPRVSVQTVDGRALEGFALNRSATDLQLLTTERRLLLFRASGDRYRAVTSQVDWPTYHGHLRGNRFSAITEIDATNVARLAPAWVFTLPDASRLQVTPLVVGGVMYVTNANECFALDAGSGRRLWHYQRPRTKGLAGDAASGINRGVAVAGDRVFMVTDHAHLIALDRFTGDLVWETPMADWRENYGATSAPLAAGDLVISGRLGRRRRGARLSRGLRPGDRQGSVAVLDGAEARRARLGDLAGPGHRARLRRHLAHRHLRSPSSTRSTGRRAIRVPTTTAVSASATTSTRIRSSRWIRRPAG